MMTFSQEKGRLIVRGGGEIIWIEPFGANCLRFRSTVLATIEERDWTLLPQSEVQSQILIESGQARISNGNIQAQIDEHGSVRYSNRAGQPILEELWIDGRVRNADLLKARNYKSRKSDLHQIELYFRAFEDERFYGMGQYANDCLNLKGCALELAQKNTQISIPFVVSTRGYGFIWNNPSVGRAELVRNHTLWFAEATSQIDYLVICEDTPADIVRRYTNITGKTPLLPEWAAGFWQCKLRYRSQGELLDVAREYKRRGLPLSVIVVDFFHWPKQGDWRFDLEYWPDPRAMVQELADAGIKTVVSIWPTVDVESENYPEMAHQGLLMRTERGVPVVFTFRGMTTYFDSTNPEARSFIWQKAKENYYRYGIRMFWLDEAEPEMGSHGFEYPNVLAYDYDNIRYSLGNGLEVSNIYPFYYAQAFYEGMKSEGESEIANLIRCAWLGSQRFGVVIWSGDIPSTYDSLRKQVKTGLNMAMCGIPWWTTDIGGFYGGDPADPSFQELMVRWFQFGVFCPIFRLHGFRLPYPKDPNKCSASELTGGPNEIWSFGEKAYEIIKKLLFLRERIKPYIMQQMRRAHEDGTPVMRPLFFDFPHDPVTFEVEDSYLFGPDILVAPVTGEGVRARKVYLPQGTQWTEVQSEKNHQGGQWVEVEAPLEAVPVFLRDGAQVLIKG
ncbi:MAG TPA: TIM-barrel domain-containing protein [Atribacteraceae bacterium]|nr:TIM-barrel domain-containing protein [Atribacteraceae bacterium]